MGETELAILQTVMQYAEYAGAIIVALAVLLIALARAKIFPKLSQKAAAWLLGGGLFIFLIALIIPTFERLWSQVQTVDLVLKAESGILRQPFAVRYRTSDRGIELVDGKDGAAELRGISAGVKQLDVIDIQCGGYLMRDAGPFPIKDGKVEVAMVADVPHPPEDDKHRPDPEPLRPSISDLEKRPAFEGKDVTLFYRNLTGKPFDIVLFDYGHDPNKNIWLVRAKWIDLVPNGAQLKTYEGFKTSTDSTGWFGVWLRDKSGQYTPLHALNLFIASEPLLTIKNDEQGRPKVTVEVRSPDDATP